MASPLIVWLPLYAVARWWSIGLRPVLPWLKIRLWVAWGFVIALYLTHLARDRFPWVYGVAMFMFSAIPSLREGWVKRRFAPDLIEPSSPDARWPRVSSRRPGHARLASQFRPKLDHGH